MSRSYTKSEVTSRVLLCLRETKNSEYTETHDHYMSRWWITRRSACGFQLSRDGNSAFLSAEIEGDDRTLDTSGWGTVWQIERKLNIIMPCPFFVEHNKLSVSYRHSVVRLYDTRITMWVDLLGNLNDYVARYESRA